MWRGGVGAAYLLPALSSAGASLASPGFRFHIPLIEPDGRISLHHMWPTTYESGNAARTVLSGGDQRWSSLPRPCMWMITEYLITQPQRWPAPSIVGRLPPSQ
jgi:hypothetical protein